MVRPTRPVHVLHESRVTTQEDHGAKALLERRLRTTSHSLRVSETLRCAWCVWQSRGLTCLSSFCATGEIAHGRRAQLSAACLRAQVTPGRRSGRRWLTRKTKAAAHTHSCSVSLRALLCCALRVARSRETLRCAWCVWQSRGLTCLSLALALPTRDYTLTMHETS